MEKIIADLWLDNNNEYRRMEAEKSGVIAINHPSWQYLGRTEILVDKSKKEIEKEISVQSTTQIYGSAYKIIDNVSLPKDAYDITIHYKVKE